MDGTLHALRLVIDLGDQPIRLILRRVCDDLWAHSEVYLADKLRLLELASRLDWTREESTAVAMSQIGEAKLDSDYESVLRYVASKFANQFIAPRSDTLYSLIVVPGALISHWMRVHHDLFETETFVPVADWPREVSAKTDFSYMYTAMRVASLFPDRYRLERYDEYVRLLKSSLSAEQFHKRGVKLDCIELAQTRPAFSGSTPRTILDLVMNSVVSIWIAPAGILVLLDPESEYVRKEGLRDLVVSDGLYEGIPWRLFVMRKALLHGLGWTMRRKNPALLDQLGYAALEIASDAKLARLPLCSLQALMAGGPPPAELAGRIAAANFVCAVWLHRQI
jgi:hypothetical protein